MRQVIFSLFFLSIIFSASAQSPIGSIFPFDPRKSTILDTAIYRINYKVTCILDPSKGDMVTNDMYLLLGQKISKFGQVAVLDDQKEIIETINRGVGCGVDARGLAGIEVYKYPHSQKPYSELTIKLFIYEYSHTFVYKDSLHSQSWTLTNERKDILGYACQKATSRFRGRDYTAWIALDIPISNGPWLLGGLPGLILEAYDSKREYSFLATSITKPKTTLPISKYKDRYKATNRHQLWMLCKRMHTNLTQAIQASFPKVKISSEKTSFPYNPIELE